MRINDLAPEPDATFGLNLAPERTLDYRGAPF
jgi:hypothetical protein